MFSAIQSVFADHYVGLFGSTLIGLVVNFVAQTIFPANLIDGIPAWNWYVAVLTQLLIYPSLSYLAWSSKEFSLSWLECGWRDNDSSSLFYELCFMYAFFGYLGKDMWALRSNLLFIIHHIACMVGILIALKVSYGVGAFVAAVSILEAGTLSYNLRCIFKAKWAISMYHIVLTISNLGTVAMQIWYFYTPANLTIKIASAVLIFGIVIGRQQEVYADWKKISAKEKEEEELAKAKSN
mmetsp:Transcript_2742/g.3902  ORF Transcript_2742/g.3902 Transcript_2742/m.3902 type:complete len:238 (+) Transcript_2742:160-873(+)